MKSVYLITAVALTAIAGVLFGVHAGMVVSHKRVDRIGDRAPERILHHMTERIELSETQRAEFDTIVFNVHTQIVALQEAFVPKIDAAMEDAFKQIEGILGEEQMEELKQEVEQFEQHQQRLRRPRRQAGGPRVPGGPPPHGDRPPPPRREGGPLRTPRFDGPPPEDRDLGAPPPPQRAGKESPDIIISNLIVQLEQLLEEEIPAPEKMHKLRRILMPKREHSAPPESPIDGPGGGGGDMPIRGHGGLPGR
jgi:hypothetical protein